MEADPNQMEEIGKLLLNKGFTNIFTKKDLGGMDRVIGGKYEK